MTQTQREKSQRKKDRDAQLEQERKIAADREQTGVSEVRLHHLPNAYRLQLMRRFGTDRGNTLAWWVLEHALKGYSHSWLDHWGSTVIGGQRVFVSEPYLNPNDIPEIERFAADAGFTVEFQDDSWWFPGSTTRIIFRMGNGSSHLIAKSNHQAPTERTESAPVPATDTLEH